MNSRRELVMTISLNALEHLGINLYSNLPAVLSEIVANAMSDADGTASLQQLERLVFSVYHLCDMVRDLRNEYREGFEAAAALDMAGKAVLS